MREAPWGRSVRSDRTRADEDAKARHAEERTKNSSVGLREMGSVVLLVRESHSMRASRCTEEEPRVSEML